MLRIDLGDERPLEDQIATGLRNAIAQGSVAAGQDLPSVRQLASDLGVHWNTVARAYRRLADEGLVTVRRGRGAVAGAGHRAPQRVSRAAIRKRLADVVAAGLVGGLSRDDVVTAFEEALASFGERRRS
jgi:DNA-binding transcriptional regulator YhcF (GntR family)